MGEVKTVRPVLLVMAAFSRHDTALDWARETAVRAWGPIALASEHFAFADTKFYERTMGPGLRKCFFAFERLIDPAAMAECKRTTNDWEADYQATHAHDEPRPLNLDPGYLTEAKLVLATTKDRDHRLYLDRGIFAEVTLFFQQHAWQSHKWTYPDYRSPTYHPFFLQCRDYLRQRYKSAP